MTCTFVADGDCSDEAAARMTIDPYDTGREHSTMTLCYEHLNRWLDRIDDSPWLSEPLRLEFLDWYWIRGEVDGAPWAWWSCDPRATPPWTAARALLWPSNLERP